MSEYVLSKNELKHYGIKGQKWGTRRWQYEDGRFNAEGKERYFGSKNTDSKKSQEKINSKTFNFGKNSNKSLRNNGQVPKEVGKEKNQNSEEKTHYSKDAQYFKDRGDKAIKEVKRNGVAITALSVAALAGSAYMLYKSDGSYEVQELAIQLGIMGGIGVLVGASGIHAANSAEKSRKEIEEKAAHSEFKSLSDIPKASIDYKNNYFNDPEKSAEELMDGVNPGYPNPGSNSNCMLCTSAMVMRLKGYDVKANTTDNGFESFAPEDWFNDCEVKKFKPMGMLSNERQKEAFTKELKEQGNGAYGNLMVQWFVGGGHSILYTVKDDKVHFIDGQVGQEYDLDDIWDYVVVEESAYCRLDQSTPKEIARGLILRNG